MINASRKRGLEGNIKKFYLFKMLLTSAGIVLPIWVLFFQNNGLSLTQVMILQSAYAISTLIFEIPTGYFADMFDRKKSLILSSIVASSGVLFYLFGNNFLYFFVGEIVFGLADAFASGADEAFLYDNMKELGRKKEYKKILGSATFYYMIVLAALNIGGAFVASFDLMYPFYVFFVLTLAMVPLTLSFLEPKRSKRVNESGYLRDLYVLIRDDLVRNVKLRWTVFYAAIIYAFYMSALWFYQPYMQLSGIGLVYVGLIFAAFNIIAATSSKYAYKIEEKIGKRYSMLLLVLALGSSYLLMGNIIIWFSFIFAFLQQFTRGFSKVVFSDQINRIASSRSRATILSVMSLLGNLFYSGMIIMAGVLADAYGIPLALNVIGFVTVFLGVPMLLVLRKAKVI